MQMFIHLLPKLHKQHRIFKFTYTEHFCSGIYLEARYYKRIILAYKAICIITSNVI